MGILTRKAIKEAINKKQIRIDPYDESQMNTNSYDLRLGRGIKVYKNWTCVGNALHKTDEGLIRYDIPKVNNNKQLIDLKQEPEVDEYEITERGFILEPGIFYLMHTEEQICSDHFVPVLDGKSSIARVGIKIHFTAGYGDIGFDGQYTLEVEVAGPVKVYAGMRIGQIRFHGVIGEKEDYKDAGHYVGNAAHGAVASRVHQQLSEDDV